MIHAKNALSARSKIRGVAYALTLYRIEAEVRSPDADARLTKRQERCAQTVDRNPVVVRRTPGSCVNMASLKPKAAEKAAGETPFIEHKIDG